jgi:hypothetical protein
MKLTTCLQSGVGFLSSDPGKCDRVPCVNRDLVMLLSCCLRKELGPQLITVCTGHRLGLRLGCRIGFSCSLCSRFHMFSYAANAAGSHLKNGDPSGRRLVLVRARIESLDTPMLKLTLSRGKIMKMQV